MKKKRITCEQHDYIEIVCMKQYPIKLTMDDGIIIECTALDTKTNTEGHECIKVKNKNDVYLIELSKISHLKVCIHNPYFDSISFF